jgi:DNA-binding CsgD family transcriptional regulator
MKIGTPRDVQWQVAQLPKGTMTLKHFSDGYGISEQTVKSHVKKGRKGERIAITNISYKGRIYHFITPDQQEKALAFWDKYRIQRFSSRCSSEGDDENIAYWMQVKESEEMVKRDEIGSLLAPQEFKILCLFGQGYSTKGISESLGLEPTSLDALIDGIIGKLGLSSSSQLGVYALKKGIVHLDDVQL